MKEYMEYILQETKHILAIDSPTGFTGSVVDYVMEKYEELGYCPVKTEKGGVLVDLGGRDKENGILLEAHADTIGCMVAEVKENGRLRLTNLGGLRALCVERENCRLYTRDGRVYEGTFQLNNPSTHVNKEFGDTKRDYDTMELVLDEDVSTKEETKKLGIRNGDIVAIDPRTVFTKSGYIKSRFLDDKLAVAIFLGYAKYLKERDVALDRRVYQHIPVYEEVGHGACGTVPKGVTEVLAMDMGCVGIGLEGSERKVSICAKDRKGPYNYEMTTALITAAERGNLNYAVDVYPLYSSDADAALEGGYDLRHALIGPGVYASHGYERSHVEGVENTLRLLAAYLEGR